MSSTRVSAVTKTDDQIYVLSTIKILVTFLWFLYWAKEGWVVKSIECDAAILKIITTMQKW